LAKVAFKTDRKCQVATGEWFDPYTGETVTDATRLDIDHMIPLKNAHDREQESGLRQRKVQHGWAAGQRGRPPARPCGSCSSRLKVTVVGDPSQRPINGFYGLTS